MTLLLHDSPDMQLSFLFLFSGEERLAKMKNWKNVIYKSNVLDNYVIDNNGCVKNIITGNICNPFEIKQKNGDRLLFVSLKIDTKFKNVPIHRIVAETYIPNPFNYKYVLFIDGNNHNIAINNLIWSNHTCINYEEKRKKQQVKHVAKRRQQLKKMAIEYKGGKCLICGYNRCDAALEFHHLNPDEKDFSIGKDGYTRGWEKIKDELDKCICVCANCHREIHNGIINMDEYL